MEPVSLRAGTHIETIHFIRGSLNNQNHGPRTSLIEKTESISRLGQEQVANEEKKQLAGRSWLEPAKVLNDSHEPAFRNVKVKSANILKVSKELELLILNEYCDLAEAFSERELDVLLPHCPTDCPIKILPGAKLSKLKMYSMMLREKENLQGFIDKNLARGCIQPAKSRMCFSKKRKTGLLGCAWITMG